MECENIVRRLLTPAWEGIPPEFKHKYARNIWEQFENQLKSAAYTSSLPRFFEALTHALDINIRKEDAAGVAGLLQCGEDRSVLRTIRDETTMLVLLLRLENDKRRELRRQQQSLNAELERKLEPGELPLYTEDEIRTMEAK
jgi:hypothetical protein